MQEALQVCHALGVSGILLAASKSLPSSIWILIALAGVLLGIIIGSIIGRRLGRRALAQRLIALGSRLGIGPPVDESSIEGALSYLEQVTGAATEAVTESSADAIRLRRSLDTLPIGLVLCDESGTVLYRNELASSMMASRQGDVLAAQAVTELLAEGWEMGSAERVLDLYGPPRRTLGVSATQIDDGRRPLGVIAVIEDISERKRLDEVRRDFIANVSHELKTPMGAMGLLSETLLVEKDRDVAKRLADRIHSEAFRVSRIIDDLLDLSRLESELTSPQDLVPVNLAVFEASDRVRSSADQQNISIHVVDPETSPIVRGDSRQLVSALHALLENAMTYSEENTTITITTSLAEPQLEIPPASPMSTETTLAAATVHSPQAGWTSSDTTGHVVRGKTVRISVADKGIGIPAKDLERIFERFYRVDRGRSRDTGGTGLGLAIVRHVAQNHGGAVEVESREGEGSTFTLVLPILEEH
jgi:two-component system sensor histidine kinase SenX3